MSLIGRFLDPNLIERLQQLQLSARGVVEGSTVGWHKSPMRGPSVEFRQHRSYVPGDEPRRLDWRVLGRTDRPYVKEYDQETNVRCLLLLDCSGSMAYGGAAGASPPTKFDYACRLTAALTYLMLAQTESVGLALFRQRIGRWLSPRSGTGQLARVIDVLERTGPKGRSSPAAAMRDAAGRLGRRGLVIMVSDFFAPARELADGLAVLKHDRHEVICLRVVHRDEVTFPFQRWSHLRGLEGEAAVMCEPALVRRRYLENFQEHEQAVQAACSAWHSEYQSFVTDQPLAEAMTRFLSRRAGR